MIRSVRFAAAFAAAAPLLFSSIPARAAGAVLHPASESDPTTLDAEIAVASTPYATTRWMRVHVAGPSRVLWLVPVRAGAAVDWASDAWLDSLDDATAPRVTPPDAFPPCGFGHATERVPSWVGKDPTRPSAAVGVHLTLDDLHAAAASFAIDSATDSALGAIFASGGAVLSVPIDIPSFTVAASATLRVTDDAPSEIPLALFGSSAAIAHVDAIAIAPLPASVAGARDIDPSLLTWGASGSSYGAARASAFGAGASWIRESSMREPLFDGVPSASAPALVDRFAPTCAGTMRDAASASGAVGRACPAGGAARVPGGSGCAPISGAIDPSSFACAGSDDLALALSGSTPRSVVVSRLSGVVTSGAPGQGDALATGSTRGLLVQAGSYASCAEPPPVSGGGSSSSSSSSSGG
ncbi:MAG TPA: hypothetical protein VIF62_35225, partial [Labilithrix sp.]